MATPQNSQIHSNNSWAIHYFIISSNFNFCWGGCIGCPFIWLFKGIGNWAEKLLALTSVVILKSAMIPAGIYIFKVKNRNTRTRCEVCSKLTLKTPERRQWRNSGIFIANFELVNTGWDGVNRCRLLICFYIPWKHQKTWVFLISSDVIGRKYVNSVKRLGEKQCSQLSEKLIYF